MLQCMCVNTSLSEYIYVTKKICLIMAFSFCISLIQVCVWQYVHACLGVDNWI